jgi:putative copper resistance protein D
VARSAAFAGALVAFAVATMSGLAAYDTVRFSAHVVQHLLLGMVVPLLLVAARPLTLALQAGSRPTQVTLLRALHHPVVRVASQPLVALVAFAGTLWVLYVTPLYDFTVRNDAAHLVLHVHFVVVGVLFYGAVLATEPRPSEVPPATRVGLAFLALPAHAFLGMALLAGSTIVTSEGGLADQRLGAGLLLSVGELLGLVVVLAAVWSWMGAEARVDDRERRAVA